MKRKPVFVYSHDEIETLLNKKEIKAIRELVIRLYQDKDSPISVSTIISKMTTDPKKVKAAYDLIYHLYKVQEETT